MLFNFIQVQVPKCDVYSLILLECLVLNKVHPARCIVPSYLFYPEKILASHTRNTHCSAAKEQCSSYDKSMHFENSFSSVKSNEMIFFKRLSKIIKRMSRVKLLTDGHSASLNLRPSLYFVFILTQSTLRTDEIKRSLTVRLGGKHVAAW